MNMKKLIIILTFLFSLTTYSQVKISAMPFWAGSMDSAYVPIVVNLVNYKTLTSRINQTRIDSIVNNWPAGGSAMRFGYPTEDFIANETRDFDQNANPIVIHGDAFTHYVGDITEASTFSTLYHDGGTFEAKAGNGSSTDDYDIVAYRNGTFGRVDISATSAAGTAAIQIGNNTGWSSLIQVIVPTGNLRFTGLIDSAQSKILYTNTSNGKITYGAVPSGSGSGIQSIEGNNGVTVLTDSIVQWGSSTNSGVPFTGNRWLNTSTFVATIRGSSVLWPLQVENTGNAYAARFSTNAAPAIQVANVPANVATIATIADFVRAGSGSSSAGVGGALDTYVWIDNTNGSTYAGSTFFTLTNTTYATRSSDFGIKVVNSAATSTAVLVKASGNMELQNAGKGYALRSPNNTVYYIVVDNSGNLSTTTTAP
jgi:hypothetical protein